MNSIHNPVNTLMKYFTITLLITVIGLLIGNMLPYTLIAAANILLTVLIIVTFIIAIFAKRPKQGSRRGFSMSIVYGYAFLLGITLTPTLAYYVGTLGSSTVIAVFIGTLLIVGALSFLSYTQGNDNILKFGPILFVSTIVLFVISIISLFFLKFTMVQWLITISSIIIFSLWVVYDIYRFKRESAYISTKRELAPYVLDIYIDFINLFLDLLRLIALIKGND